MKCRPRGETGAVRAAPSDEVEQTVEQQDALSREVLEVREQVGHEHRGRPPARRYPRRSGLPNVPIPARKAMCDRALLTAATGHVSPTTDPRATTPPG
jgi:hypothetical protein